MFRHKNIHYAPKDSTPEQLANKMRELLRESYASIEEEIRTANPETCEKSYHQYIAATQTVFTLQMYAGYLLTPEECDDIDEELNRLESLYFAAHPEWPQG